MAPLLNGIAAGILLSAAVVSGQGNSRLGASPSYQGFNNICPERCIVTGPNPSNWSTYHHMKQLDRCDLPVFYGFNLYDDVDDTDSYHRILACTAYGHDWRENSQARLKLSRPVEEYKVNYEIGWSSYSEGTESEYRSLIRQMRDYIARGHIDPSKTAMLYSRIGATSAGIYIGNSLQSKDISDVALESLIDDSHDFDGRRDSLAMQLCGPHYDSQHVFGFLALRNGTFRAIQSAFESWSNAECLDFEQTTNFTASTHFTSPMLSSIKPGNTTTSSMKASGSTLTAKSSMQQKRNQLFSRAECKTEKVQDGDSCAAIASRCGISGADFTKYNSAKGFCSKLKPGQHVCCSSGTLPDFSPKPHKDGSCATTTVGDGESCSTIAAANGITEKDIDGFNKKTWGWTGCKNIFKNSVICVSKGSPPMPAEVSDAQCGPQVRGTKPPKDMSTLADLNPCPLNACCNTFGHVCSPYASRHCSELTDTAYSAEPQQNFVPILTRAPPVLLKPAPTVASHTAV